MQLNLDTEGEEKRLLKEQLVRPVPLLLVAVISLKAYQQFNCFYGLVVKASASRVKGRGFKSLANSIIDSKMGVLGAALSDAQFPAHLE